MRMWWAYLKLGLKPGQLLHRSADNDLNRAVRKVPDPSRQSRRIGLPLHEVPVADSLYLPAHHEAGCHFFRPGSSPLTTSRPIGISDTAMIPMTTRLKWSRTTDMLPKKYPAPTNSPTHTKLPVTLKPRNLP